MEIEVLKENLKNGLVITERVATKNLSLPILENILISTENSFLTLTATDLETAVKVWILGKIIKKGQIVVPAKFFSTLISLLSDEKITLKEEKQKLYIEGEKFKNYIQGLNPEDFPLLPKFENQEYIEIDGKKLAQAISQVIDLTNPSSSRPEIGGVYFLFFKNNLKIVATDSFRLAEKKISFESNIDKNFSFILPRKTAREIINIFSTKEEKVRLYPSINQVCFESTMKEINHPEIYIISRLIEGEYPNYQDIIPTTFKNCLFLQKDEFITKLKTTSLFSGKGNEVKIKINPKEKNIEILAKDVNIGEAHSILPCRIEGPSTEVSFNYKFLLDGLVNIKSSELKFEISKEDGPCVLRPIGDDTYFYVVMPIKSS